jgi:hypothetical protein
MKKILLLTSLLSLSFGMLGSCSKAAAVVATNCEANAKKVTDAGTAFFADPTNKTKCQAYITAINDMYKSCPTYYSAAVKKSLDDALANACK